MSRSHPDLPPLPEADAEIDTDIGGAAAQADGSAPVLAGAVATPRYRIWSEYTPYPVLHEPQLLGELARRGIQLAIAVTPQLAPELVAVVRSCQKHGVAVAVWPMLSDAQGRWVSAENADIYCRFVLSLLQQLSAQAALPQALAIDLEPPIERLRRLKNLQPAQQPRRSPQRAADGAAALTSLASEARARGLELLAAVMPPIVLPPEAAARGWQRLLRTPIDALPLDCISTMAYTSLFEGYSRGVLRRADARALLYKLAVATRARYGARASISLGAVGTGALGDERTFISPAQLIEDVGIVRAAGLTDLALFNLDGALARPPLAAWLDALVQTPPSAPPPPTLRADLLWQGLRAAGALAGLC